MKSREVVDNRTLGIAIMERYLNLIRDSSRAGKTAVAWEAKLRLLEFEEVFSRKYPGWPKDRQSTQRN